MYVQRNKTFSVLLYYQSDKVAGLSDTAASQYIKLWVRYTLQASLKLHCTFEGAKIAVKFHRRREKKINANYAWWSEVQIPSDITFFGATYW
jgi:hypothetical protein